MTYSLIAVGILILVYLAANAAFSLDAYFSRRRALKRIGGWKLKD